MIIKESEKQQKLMSLLDIDFLSRLNEVAKLVGWHCDYHEVSAFVEMLYSAMAYERPDTEPYEIVDDADESCNHAKRPGRIVQHIDGRKGRTFNDTNIIDGKVPVYFAIEYNKQVPVKFSTTASLIDPAKLSVIGYID